MRAQTEDGGRVHVKVGEVALPIDVLNLDQACESVLTRTTSSWAYVITPNAQHVSLLLEDQTLAPVFEDAVLSLPDGWPLALLAGWLMRGRVSRAPGSDLLERLVESDGEGRPILFVGGEGGEHFERLRARCLAHGWRPIREAAPRAVLNSYDERRKLIERVRRDANGGVVVVGVGAPRQEILANAICQASGTGVVLCLGMAINFSAGAVSRAPVPVQKIGLEWLYRTLQEPRRLAPRYLNNAVTLRRVIWRNVHQ